MIVSENITLRGIEYIKTYSDAGYYISDGITVYSEAIDLATNAQVYTETDLVIEHSEDEDVPTPQSNAYKIAQLESQSQLLAECILELADIIYADDEEVED